MLLPQSKAIAETYTQEVTFFKPSIIRNLVNQMLDVNLIISHTYVHFAVICKNTEALVLLLTQLLGSTVSVQYKQGHRVQKWPQSVSLC